MKKYLTFFMIVVVMLMCSCKKGNNIEDVCNEFVTYVNNLTDYEANCEMEIVRKDDSVKFDVVVDYLTPKYYKVTFDNSTNNNKQIIVKNDEGVYVLTPSLNKEFKFESDWPLNSSHAYLVSSIIKDMANDNECSATKEGDNYVIRSKVDHKTNKNLVYQKITIDAKTLKPKSVFVYNASDEALLKVKFKDFKTNCGFKVTDFNVAKTMEENVNSLGEGYLTEVNGTIEAGYVIDGANLTKSSIEKDISILCYTGDINYTIISQKVEPSSVATPVRVYEDFILIDSGIAALTKTSLTYCVGDQEVTIVGASLTVEQYIEIANSINFA